MKKFLAEFKEFALKGNVMDLAVGVIIGAAFADIVTSLTDNFINPLLQLLTHPSRFADLTGSIIWDSIARYGSNFLSAVINFVIMAFILFCIVKAVNKAMTIGKKEEEEEKTTQKCPFCQSEISIKATRCPNCTSEIEYEETEA